MIFTGDQSLTEEWAHLVKNILSGNGYSYFTVDGVLLPSSYMPPVYAYFLVICIKIAPEFINPMILIGLIQSFFGSLCCYYVYKISCYYFTEKISFISMIVTSFFPLFIYASGQCSSVNIYVLLNLIIFTL